MDRWFWIGLGGAAGTLARYGLSTWCEQRLGDGFPYGTLAVNVIGSFLLGAIGEIAATTQLLSPTLRLSLSTGVMGGFTTYSSFNNVTIRRGGKVLFDSRARASYPNKRPINVGIKPFTAVARDGALPVFNLSDEMARFRRSYYEIGDNPILAFAYSDLAQTDKRKYANRGTNWCSEFATSCYRQAGYETPDPNAGDVHWKNMREFFEKNGQVFYRARFAGFSGRDDATAMCNELKKANMSCLAMQS